MPDRQRGAAAERRILDGRYWSGSNAGIPDPRPRQLRDAQQSCRYPTREYQLDRPSLKMAPPRSLSGNRVSQIRPPRTVGRTNSPPLTKKAISTFALNGRAMIDTAATLVHGPLERVVMHHCSLAQIRVSTAI